jgi:hypothetical protein
VLAALSRLLPINRARYDADLIVAAFAPACTTPWTCPPCTPIWRQP